MSGFPDIRKYEEEIFKLKKRCEETEKVLEHIIRYISEYSDYEDGCSCGGCSSIRIYKQFKETKVK